MFHGFIGCLYYSINFIIANNRKCGTFNYYFKADKDQIIDFTYNFNFNLSDYVCRYRINNNNTNLEEAEYFDTFEIHDDVNWWSEIIIIICGILTFFVIKFSYISIIKYLSPIHLIFSIPIYYVYGKIVMLIHNVCCSEHKFFLYNDNIEKLSKFYLDIAGDITAAIGFLIYLEIVILNFKGYNYNIKSNIILRGRIDSSLKEERESGNLEYNIAEE